MQRLIGAVLAVALGSAALADSALPKFDALAERALAEYDAPGIAIGLVQSGRIVHARGYGVREIGKGKPVDTDTLFKIASNSKAMTAASLALLVDAGQLDWHDRVIDHLPAFRLHDPWVTREFTVVDLLTHRSGLAPWVGDLMLWPEPNDFSREDIVHNLRYFEPATRFRDEYAYDNLLYVVAGELVAAVAGEPWEAFVDRELFATIGARRCFAGRVPRRAMRNAAAPHGMLDGELAVIERSRIGRDAPVSVAAGGVRCSLDGMLRWVSVQLARGALDDGERVYSEAQANEMWTPRTFLPVSEQRFERDRTHFRTYALGWRVADVRGYRHVSHTGTLSGWSSYVVLIPELQLGAVVLTNGSDSRVREAVMLSMIRPFLGQGDVDWFDWLQREREARASEQPDEAAVSLELPPPAELAGRYRDRWFGIVDLDYRDGSLTFRADRSPRLAGTMTPVSGPRFVVQWDDPSVDGAVLLTFAGTEPGRFDRFVMRSLDPSSDFEFDDLEFVKDQPPADSD